MISWLSTEITAPKAGREIVARNPDKHTHELSSAKQCRVIRFHHSFSESLIRSTMLDDNFTLWAYVEGEHDE